MNDKRVHRRRTPQSLRKVGPRPVVQARARNIMVEAFQKTGCVPAVELVAKALGVKWALVNQCYQEIIDELPGREAVESAYEDFLSEACGSQKKEPTKELLQNAACAKLTARRVGRAIQLEPELIARRAAELGIQLSEFEAPGLAVPRRLTERALGALQQAQVSPSTAARVAGVAIQTLAVKIKRLNERREKQNLERQKIQKNQVIITALAEIDQGEHIGEMLVETARKLLSSAGDDPDELIPGAYVPADCLEEEFCCDKIRIIDGQAVGFIHAYRREASRIRKVMDIVLQTAREGSAETSTAQIQ